MGIIAWIVLGLIAGAIAKYIMPGRDPGGIIVTIILGIVGAVVGGVTRFARPGRLALRTVVLRYLELVAELVHGIGVEGQREFDRRVVERQVAGLLNTG